MGLIIFILVSPLLLVCKLPMKLLQVKSRVDYMAGEEAEHRRRLLRKMMKALLDEKHFSHAMLTRNVLKR